MGAAAGKPTSSPSQCVCATLRKASRAITQLYDNALRPAGIRSTQFNILAEIHHSREATLVELTERLHLDQTTLTRSLRLLEEMNLLERAPRPDARLKALRLSQAGLATLENARPLWDEVQREVVASLGGAGSWAAIQNDLRQIVAATVLTAEEK
jgi:DNA-binding MarR family transcriptional regulator